MAASSIHLSFSHKGIIKEAEPSADAVEECSRLLQKNHDKFHVFFRDTAGHNHISHSLLTLLALGATSEELQDRFNDGTGIQRTIPAIDHVLLEKLNDTEVFYDNIGQITQYHTFLEFFMSAIAANGWKEVIQEYVFARTKLADTMLARLYEGAYHPIIHLGLGIEFQEGAIIAEGLAQAASHDNSNIGTLFRNSECEAAIAYPTAKPKSMIQLIHEVRANDTIRKAPQWSDFGNKMRDGIMGRAGEEMSTVAAQFQIRKDDVKELERRTAEMISTCAYFAGASQRQGRKKKIDFFYMHTVTSSLFFTVLIRQEWIKLEDRVRLVEWKARLDLAWYAVCGCPPLDREAISSYSNPKVDELGWTALFDGVRKEHDDGHTAKFLRALKNGEQVASKFDQGEWAEYFPMKSDMWLKLARMCHDTTTGMPTDLKWIPFTGFDQPWKRPDLGL